MASSIDDAAAAIGCTRRTVWNMLRDGRLARAGLGAPRRRRSKPIVLVDPDTIAWAIAARRGHARERRRRDRRDRSIAD
jgi:hypothetical protein